MDTPWLAELVLRLIGGFYLLGSVIGLRQAALTGLLDAAIAAIGMPDPREAKAARQRNLWMATNLVLVGTGGIALLLLLSPAAPLFLLGSAAQAAYLLVVAPRHLDPWDEPDAAGRAATWRAFWLHLGVTAVVLAAFWRGALAPLHEAGWPLLALAAGAFAALLAFALRQWRLSRPRGGPGGVRFEPEPRRSGLLLTPSWDAGALFDARSGEALATHERDELLTATEFRDVEAWLALFAELADPDDPRQCALKDPADLARIEAAGRPILASLRARLGAAAVEFAPAPRPRQPRIVARRVRVAAVPGERPLWCLDDDPAWPFDPREFGISWGLANALLDWSSQLDEATDWDAPGRPLRWSAQERAAHAQRGEELAQRIARELAATGRADVEVTLQGPDGTETQLRPGEPSA